MSLFNIFPIFCSAAIMLRCVRPKKIDTIHVLAAISWMRALYVPRTSNLKRILGVVYRTHYPNYLISAALAVSSTRRTILHMAKNSILIHPNQQKSVRTSHEMLTERSWLCLPKNGSPLQAMQPSYK